MNALETTPQRTTHTAVMEDEVHVAEQSLCTIRVTQASRRANALLGVSS